MRGSQNPITACGRARCATPIAGTPNPTREENQLQPKTLSASSLDKYEKCPARWKAETFNYGSSPDSPAALSGTVCHAVLERWVVEGHYKIQVNLNEATRLFDYEYNRRFAD